MRDRFPPAERSRRSPGNRRTTRTVRALLVVGAVGASLLMMMMMVMPAVAAAAATTTGGRHRRHRRTTTRRIRSIDRRSSNNDEEALQDHQGRRGLATGGSGSGGNPLAVLQKVWNDAANQKASDVQSDCIKVPKGSGKGGKGGSLKSSGTPTVAPTTGLPTTSPAPTSKSLKSISKASKSPKSTYCEDRPAGPPSPTITTSAPSPRNDFVPPSSSGQSPPSPPPQEVPPPLVPTTSQGVPPTATPGSPPNQPIPPPLQPEVPTPSPQKQQQPPSPPAPTAVAPTASSSSPPPVVAPPTPGGGVTSPTAPTAAVQPPNAAPTTSGQPPPATPAAAPSRAPTNSNTGRCAQVADETLVTNATESQTWRLTMQVQLASTTDVQTALQQLQSALQTQVAPTLTNCASTGSSSSTTSQRQRVLQTTGGGTDTTQVQNVVFGPRSAKEFVTCPGQSSSSSICLNTAGRVTAYGTVPDTFYDDMLSTVQDTPYDNVNGLQQVTDASALSGGDPVPEGSGNDSNDDRTEDDGGNSVIEGPSGNVSPNDGSLSAGAAVGIALAALVVLLCALFAYRGGRRQRGYDRRDAALKLAAHTEDEDDLVLGSGGEGVSGGDSVPDDEYSDDDRIPGRRKVHVLGEDDSLMAGSMAATSQSNYYRDRNVEIRPVRVPYDGANDRNAGIKFVATAGAAAVPRPSPTIPPDASRTYAADDTVLL